MIMMTLIIIAVTVAVSLLAWQSPKLMDRLIFYPPAIKKGQVDRFLTHGFIHKDCFHLFFNMITLFSFGQGMQKFYNQKLGVIGFLLFYLFAIVVSSIPDYVKYKNNRNFASLGASGGVSAVIFAFVLFQPWSILWFFFIPMPAILFAILYTGYVIYLDGKNQFNINHTAHLVGGIVGMLVTIVIEPSIVPHFFNALMHPKF